MHAMQIFILKNHHFVEIVHRKVLFPCYAMLLIMLDETSLLFSEYHEAFNYNYARKEKNSCILDCSLIADIDIRTLNIIQLSKIKESFVW